jgi:hypothetical protein
VIFCYCAESSSFSLHPENATGWNATCTTIVCGCWHFVGKWLNARHGFLAEQNG